MAIKLLPENLPPLFSFQASELGSLCCFPLRVKDWERLHTKQLEGLSDDEWVRVFISASCNKEESLKGGQYKPGDSVLSDEEVTQLSQSELEDFAMKFVNSDSFLKKYKDDDAQKKRDDESNTTYLRRIYNHYHSNLATSKLSKKFERSIAGSKTAFEALQQLNKLTGAARAHDILSASTLESIEKLREQENAIAKSWQPTTPPPYQIPPSPQISAAQKSELHLEALKSLLLASNEVQTDIRKDITTAIADSRNISRWNLIISGSVLILTTLGLFLAYWTAQTSSEQMDRFMGRMSENSSAVVKPLEALGSSVNTANENGGKLTRAIDSLGAEVKLLRKEQQNQKVPYQEGSALKNVDKKMKEVR